jgi:hypothetical protein
MEMKLKYKKKIDFITRLPIQMLESANQKWCTVLIKEEIF